MRADSMHTIVAIRTLFDFNLMLHSRYTFGYGRYEVLSGFTNGILLVFVSLMVLGEGIGRLFGNPEIDAEHLTIVAVAGFCVNLIGLYWW